MTKKHYEAIANIIKETCEHDAKYTEQINNAFKILSYQMAHYFENDNPKFNRDRFLTACGVIEK